MKKLFAFTLSLLAGTMSITAQNWCGSVEHRHELNADKPEEAIRLQQRLEAFNAAIQDNPTKATEDYVIPVVFHVIHEGGSENISFEQIEDQMRILNEDFARLNEDTVNTPSVFAEYAGDTHIQFRLAKKDPDGNCTQGVTRMYSSLTNDARDNVKSLVQWDPTKYLNVWVVRTIEQFTQSGGIVLGFAQFPDQLLTNPETDGIVLRHDYCGSIESAMGQYGRTLTHEAGHWLNLRHIWGDSDCGDDNVNDTPTAKEPNYGICDDNFPHHVGECDTSVNQIITQSYGEMFMNYMDYSSDHCMNMFSLGQGQRMQAAIETYRSELVSESNAIATGINEDNTDTLCAPIADFTSDINFGCPGQEIDFFDKSYNTSNIETYQWYFEGATPSTSTDANPTVIYNEQGTFPVTLTVGNTSGETTELKAGFITIFNPVAATSAPYYKTFEGAFTNHENEDLSWIITETESPSWEHTSEAASPNIPSHQEINGNSIRIRSSYFTTEGEVHTLISPSMDLSNLSSAFLYFDLAYAQKNNLTDDNLSIYFSDNCGVTWSKRFDKNTEDLITNGGGLSFFDFIPNEAQWVKSTDTDNFKVNMNSFSGKSNVKIRIEFTGKEGNWLYLDNIIVCSPSQLLLLENKKAHFDVYPNPSKGDATISYNLTEASEVTFSVLNVFGAKIAEKTMNLAAERNSIELSELHNALEAGIYMIKLDIDGISNTKKIVITE